MSIFAVEPGGLSTGLLSELDLGCGLGGGGDGRQESNDGHGDQECELCELHL